MTTPLPITDIAAEIRDEFAFLDDWEARFQHIIDMGKSLPPLEDEDFSEANKVRGCASQVWLIANHTGDGRIEFRGASDAMIVSGLVGIILRLFSGQKADDIAAFDAEAFFSEIGVAEALTPQRSNGLKSMLTRIRTEAAGD